MRPRLWRCSRRGISSSVTEAILAWTCCTRSLPRKPGFSAVCVPQWRSMTPLRPPPQPWRSSTMGSRPWPSTVWGISRCPSAPTGPLVGSWRTASPKTSWHSGGDRSMRRHGKRPYPDHRVSAPVTIGVVYHPCRRHGLGCRGGRHSVSDPVAYRTALGAMEIRMTYACAQRHATRAHPVSPVGPLDHHDHVDAGLGLCCVVCRGSLPPLSQFPEAVALAETRVSI